MILHLTIEPIKDKTKKIKRLLTASLKTSIKGSENIHAIAELTEGCVLAQEIDLLISNLVQLKQNDINSKSFGKVQIKKAAKRKKK